MQIIKKSEMIIFYEGHNYVFDYNEIMCNKIINGMKNEENIRFDNYFFKWNKIIFFTITGKLSEK